MSGIAVAARGCFATEPVWRTGIIKRLFVSGTGTSQMSIQTAAWEATTIAISPSLSYTPAGGPDLNNPSFRGATFLEFHHTPENSPGANNGFVQLQLTDNTLLQSHFKCIQIFKDTGGFVQLESSEATGFVNVAADSFPARTIWQWSGLAKIAAQIWAPANAGQGRALRFVA